MKKFSLTLLFCITCTSLVFSQGLKHQKQNSTETEKPELTYRHSIGASLFMITNLLPDPADYYLLTYGYRLTQKDRIFAEFNTWKYAEPLGTYGDSEELYPGFVRAFGVGAGYQRFHWKGLFTTIQTTAFLKQYYNAEDTKTQKGFQLYMQLAAGYRFEFFKERLYVEPAYVLKYWPVDTNFPTDFAKIEEGAPKYIFEPSLNVGIRF